MHGSSHSFGASIVGVRIWPVFPLVGYLETAVFKARSSHWHCSITDCVASYDPSIMLTASTIRSAVQVMSLSSKVWGP